MMTPHERDRIIDERLRVYRCRLRESNATPFTCLGIGHGDQSGTVVVCITEDAELADLLMLLRGAVKMVEKELRR